MQMITTQNFSKTGESQSGEIQTVYSVTLPRYEAVLPASAEAGSVLTVLPEAILARDRDLGLNSSLVYSLPGARSEEGQRLVSVDPRTGALRLERNVTEDTLRQPLTLIVQVTSLSKYV